MSDVGVVGQCPEATVGVVTATRDILGAGIGRVVVVAKRSQNA